MGKRETKLNHAAHIKRHTVGTSNELSFSVLDAAKMRADAEVGKGNAPAFPDFGKIPLFSLPSARKKAVSTPNKESVLLLPDGSAVSATNAAVSDVAANVYHSASAIGADLLGKGVSTAKASAAPAATKSHASSEEEVMRRKTRRRHRRLFMSFFTLVFTLCVAGVGAYILYGVVTNHEEQVSLLDQSLGVLTKSDKTIQEMNQMVASAPEAETIDEINALVAKLPETEQRLDEAKALALPVSQNNGDAASKEAADQALAAIEARREMLETGVSLLYAKIQVKQDIETINQVWDTVLQADALAREADMMVTDTTEDNVRASKEKSGQAQALFSDARYLLGQLEASALSPDMQPLIDYVDKRTESIQYAMASDDALLAQNRQEAQDFHEAWKNTDAEAAGMAKRLPSDVETPVLAAYSMYTAKTRDSYEQMRLRASTADAFLRDYLGT
ncbi:MAG: hypothetical protein LBG81_09025 [Coriobacteriaceae bacterium]|jgi:hypothetical protein|nr:hypothetical protein [Coriobacteriaceae bacterium]